MKIIFMLLLPVLMSCGKDGLSSSSQSTSSSSAIYSGTMACKMSNGGNLGGCCSSHGGAKNCGTGLYSFTSTGSLICNDGTTSPTCTSSN